MNSARSKTARTNNFICNEEKLNDELSVIKDYDRAVELIRSYPICLSKKLEVFSENPIIRNLRKKHKKSNDSQKRINKVKLKIKILI
jgi:hypothetical protein